MSNNLEHNKWMQRCLDLALLGKGKVEPNPMVGCVIVRNEEIIAEGYHKIYGGAHAEVNAINKLSDHELLKDSTIYVSLEPCAHQGKTPPCVNLILEKQIPHIVIGTLDPNPLVRGKSLDRLKADGRQVEVGFLEDQCLELNRKFFTAQTERRPYVTLKWAETQDGFIDKNRTHKTPKGPNWITSNKMKILVHKWRSEHQAILIGTQTAANDDPSLNVRNWPGKNPIRLVIDKTLRLPKHLKIFDKSIPTIVYCNDLDDTEDDNLVFKKIAFDDDLPRNILNDLYDQGIQSVFIEGGAQLLQTFIDNDLWDEAYRLIGDARFEEGIKAPQLNGHLIIEEKVLFGSKVIRHKQNQNRYL